MAFVTDIEEQKRQKSLDDKKEQKFEQNIKATKAVEKAVKESGAMVTGAIKKKTDDTKGLIKSVEALGRVIAGNDEMTREELSKKLSSINKTLGIDQSKDNTAKVVDAIKNLQKSVTKKENVKVSNLDDLADFFFSLEMALKEKDFSPVINVASPDVKVDVPKIDTKAIEKAIKSIKPEVIMDNSVTKELEIANKTLMGILERPQAVSGGGGGSGGSGLTAGSDFDYVDVQQTDADTETYVFKTGGSGGATVRTIVVNYTSSAKSDIDDVTWS